MCVCVCSGGEERRGGKGVGNREEGGMCRGGGGRELTQAVYSKLISC